VGYYNQPLLKPPVWTWEVPAYFFVGGVAGVGAVIAAVGALAGADASIVRDARWMAVVGALISPALLISDLGRPDRFLNMLRVFKTKSPMSVGAWTLAVFTPAVLAALIWDPMSADASVAARLAGHAGSLVAAATGLVLATYTGVLIGVTVIPVWAAHARHLPFHFGASSLGAAVGVLELLGHRTPAMNALGIVAAVGLTLMRAHVEVDRRPASAPLKSGSSGGMTRLGDVLSGPLPLVLRLVWPGEPAARAVAALGAIAGSIVTRFGWIAAGRASVALALAALLLLPAPVLVEGRQDPKPDLSTRALVASAAKYVADYQEEFKFLLADEEYVQRLYSSNGRLTEERHLKGELFLTFLPGDGEWIAVHDFKEVDGKPVPDREDVRALLQKGDVRGTAARIAEKNARFNIGRLGRNFNEPTLPLLLLHRKRVEDIDFDRERVVTQDGRTRVTLRFKESDRQSLIRNAITTSPISAKGLLTIDALTGRVERTEFEIDVNQTNSRLVTEYKPDEKLKLWVPVLFHERYHDARERERQVIQCEARYTNYRRFEVTGRIKK
jgi:hypothetical protein